MSCASCVKRCRSGAPRPRAAHAPGRDALAAVHGRRAPRDGQEAPLARQQPQHLGLSAHADDPELLDNCEHLAGGTRRVFVVHGEERPAMIYADRLRDAGFDDVKVPLRKQRFEL
ncbi:MAG: MBL fold metallo-hydrolase RNA specificity domain-containing protein [Planctomycetota bacterium]